MLRPWIALAVSVLVLDSGLSAQEQWQPLGLIGQRVQCAAVAPGDSNRLLAGGSNVYLSTDGGQHWSTKTSMQEVWTVCFGSTANLAFAGTWGSGVYKSTDGGDSWSPSSTGLSNRVIKAIAVEPGNDSVVYCGAEDGLYKSTNGGANWTRIKDGHNVRDIEFVANDPQQILMATWGSGLWQTTDGGGSWQQVAVGDVSSSEECNGISIDASDPLTWYVVFRGPDVWITRNAGADWTRLIPGFEGFAVEADRTRSGFVYAVGGWTRPQRSGCFGATGWQAMDSGWSSGSFARGLALDPADPSVVYACGYDGGFFRWLVDVAPPSAPSGLNASAAGTGIDLDWQASGSPDVSGYWIYRRTASEAYASVPTYAVTGTSNTQFSDTHVTAGQEYQYVVAAVDNGQNRSTFSNEAGATVESSFDLDVAYIARLPRDCYRYLVDYPDGVPVLRAGTENDKRWPACGEIVTFEAHVINKGSAATPPANYRWMINGVEAGTGTMEGIAPGEEGTASLDWAWNVCGFDNDHTDQTVTFEIDHDDLIVETYEQNNALTDYIEAMSLFIHVEQQIYDAFNARLNLAGTKGFEDWIQRQILAMNDNFARSTYALAPQGCLERVRIDKIQVSSPPPTADPTSDGGWQFVGDAGYADVMAERVDNGLIHELMHQLGVIDLYQMPVGEGAGENRVVTPDGLPAGIGFGFARMGIMAGGDIAPHTSGQTQTMPQYCSSHSVVALNRNCGYRRGYYGEYMFDVPLDNTIVVNDSAGNPAANVDIKVYQGGGGEMSGTPIMTGTTDADGRFLLTNRPPYQTLTTATGHTERANPFGTINVVGRNATLLVEMSRPGGDFDYRFLNMIDFNMAYWAGLTDAWEYTINSRLASADLARITALQAAVEQSKVSLAWPAVDGASSYRVYRASRFYNQSEDPEHAYENWVLRPLADTASTQYVDTTIFENSRYAVAPVNASGEGPLSIRAFAPRLRNPWGVGILPDNQRVVLDPQNGYAFLRQTSGGIYVANTGSVHNHVEFSHFIAIDKNLNRMLTSHPSDYYSGPHSIRVTDFGGSLDGLQDYGNQGQGMGQFDNPAGVAVDADSRIFVADAGNNRVQILNSSGSFLRVFGGAGAGDGQFNNPQGIAIGPDNRVYVCDRDNHRVQVLQFTPATNGLAFVGTLTGRSLQAPTGVAVTPNGSILVTDAEANRVEQYAPAGTWLKGYDTAMAPYSGALSQPTGIAVDGLGQMIVCDTGNNRVVVVAVLRCPADLDGDSDVDPDDLDMFSACASGPAVPHDASDMCERADFDGDGDVDQSDFGVFQRCLSGAGVPGDPDCG